LFSIDILAKIGFQENYRCGLRKFLNDFLSVWFRFV